MDRGNSIIALRYKGEAEKMSEVEVTQVDQEEYPEMHRVLELTGRIRENRVVNTLQLVI